MMIIACTKLIKRPLGNTPLNACLLCYELFHSHLCAYQPAHIASAPLVGTEQ